MTPHEAVADWVGATVAVVAPGPSAGKFDFSGLKVDRTIVINDAFTLRPDADVLISGDHRFFFRDPDLSQFKGPLIVCTDRVAWTRPIDPRAVWMARGASTGLSSDPKRLHGSQTTLSLAINYAVLKGASKILLVGVDLAPAPNGDRRFNGTMKDGPKATYRYSKHAAVLKTLVEPLARKGVKVKNLNPESALTVFPRVLAAVEAAPVVAPASVEYSLPIVAFKWGKSFPLAYVERLQNMLKRHLHMKHHLVCVTDDPSGIPPGVRVVRLWRDLQNAGGKCFVRLKAFDPSMAELIGPRFAWIDLDMVIVNDVTPIFRRTEDFIISGVELRPQPYNGSLVMMNAGCRPQVFSTFNKERWMSEKLRLQYGGSDQAWIAICLGPNEATWTRKDGLFSYRDDIAPRSEWNYRQRLARGCAPLDNPSTDGAIPEGARIIQQNGLWNPHSTKVRALSPWIAEHWR